LVTLAFYDVSDLWLQLGVVNVPTIPGEQKLHAVHRGNGQVQRIVQRFSWYCASFNQRLGERHGFLVKLQDLNIFKCPKSSRRR
jgi:hypothetical protein